MMFFQQRMKVVLSMLGVGQTSIRLVTDPDDKP